ncbi:LAMI_0F03180g1_1 [Lachancea mirantina]|uniref:LAMI_0F03180g1_1 n=1 Tax=Lachancea mirantina TaxID=1230905 RepID=A0A1G4JX33_9SACH|nr:LAMI_0F03180g1_1 [Lachancea mirantina]
MIYDSSLGKFVQSGDTLEENWFDTSSTDVDDFNGLRKSEWFFKKRVIPPAEPLFYEGIRISLAGNNFADVKLTDDRNKAPAPVNEAENALEGLSREPSTLDDSDLDMLVGETSISPSPTIAANDNSSKVLETYIVASTNSLRLLCDHRTFHCPFAILDLKVVSKRSSEHDDVILILCPTGRLLCIMFDADLTPKVMQQWDFPKLSSKPVIRHIELFPDGERFVVSSNSVMRFFTFTGLAHFELTTNLYFEDSEITNYTLFDDRSRRSYTLFVAAMRFNRVIYCVVDCSTEEKKDVHPLTLLTAERVNNVIPLNENRCLIFTTTNILLVTANQVMSGEVNFRNFPRSMFGDDVCWCFNDDALLLRLKSKTSLLRCFNHCCVFATTNGALCCCLISAEGEVKFLALTRFKGLRKAYKLSNVGIREDFYRLRIVSCGRIFEILLDVTNLAEISKDYKVNALENIEQMTLIYVGHEKRASLFFSDSYKNRQNQVTALWTLSQNCFFNIASDFIITHTRSMASVEEMRFFNSIDVIKLDSSSEKWASKWLDLEARVNDELFLLTAYSPVTDPYALLVTYESNCTLSSIVELDGFYVSGRGQIISTFLTDHCTIQVTENEIILDDMSNALPHIECIGFEVHDAIQHSNKVVAWNRYNGQVVICFVKEIVRDSKYHEILYLGEADVSSIINGFFIEDNDHGTLLLLVMNNQISVYSCDDKPQRLTTLHTPLFLNCTSQHNTIIGCGVDGLLYMAKWTGLKSPPFKPIVIKGIEPALWNVVFYEADSCILHSPKKLVIVNLPHMKASFIPFVKYLKHSTILQVKTRGKLLFILHSSGMEVMELSCSTPIVNDITLPCSRVPNKIFLYLWKINRMLIVNPRNKCLFCTKLESGRTIPLDSSSLAVFDEVFDIKELKTEDYKTSVVVTGTAKLKSLVKLIQIVPKPGRLKIQEVDEIYLAEETMIYSCPTNSGNIWIFYGTRAERLHIQNGKISIDSNGSVETTDKIRFFDAADNLLIAVTVNSDIICQIQQVDGQWKRLPVNESTVASLRVVKIINYNCIVISGEMEGHSSIRGVLLFYKIEHYKLYCYDTIPFAEPIKDFEFCARSNEICVLLDDGAIIYLSACREKFDYDFWGLESPKGSKTAPPYELCAYPEESSSQS